MWGLSDNQATSKTGFPPKQAFVTAQGLQSTVGSRHPAGSQWSLGSHLAKLEHSFAGGVWGALSGKVSYSCAKSQEVKAGRQKGIILRQLWRLRSILVRTLSPISSQVLPAREGWCRHWQLLHDCSRVSIWCHYLDINREDNGLDFKQEQAKYLKTPFLGNRWNKLFTFFLIFIFWGIGKSDLCMF